MCQKAIKYWAIPSATIFAIATVHISATLYYHSSIEGDWQEFYRRSVELAESNEGFDYVRPASNFIVFLCHATHLLGTQSATSIFAIFSCIGFGGWLFFLRSIRRFSDLKLTSPATWIFLLPGIHIWTCAIGKDSVIFFALMYLLFRLHDGSFKLLPNIFAVSLAFMVRPHIAFLFAISLLIAHVFSNTSEGIIQRVSKCLLLVVALALAVPFVSQFVGIDEFSLDSAYERIEYAATKNQKGDGAIELDTYSPPFRLFTYMFRPLFYDVRNTLGFFASIENALLLIMALKISFSKAIWRLFIIPRYEVIAVLFFLLAGWFILGMSTANLGLALRQKTQLTPFLIYLYFFSISRTRDHSLHFQQLNSISTF